MLFLFETPMLAAFSNYFVPLLIGADDVAFPRINAIAFWLLPPGAVLIWSGFFLPSLAPAQTAWTMYTPLSVEQANPAVDLMLLGLHLTAVSATMGAINFVATIVTERGEGVSWSNLDIFSWTVLTQSGQIIFVWNLVQSWLEGPKVTDGDPWDLKETDQHGREWAWFERQRETALATDGGEERDGDGTAASRSDDD